MYVCMYTWVKPRGDIRTYNCAYAQMVLSQQYPKLILPGKEILEEKKRSLAQEWTRTESDALQTTAFATEPMGLWQLWTSNLALISLTTVR